jgi:hypothetical protein
MAMRAALRGESEEARRNRDVVDGVRCLLGKDPLYDPNFLGSTTDGALGRLTEDEFYVAERERTELP